MAARVRRALTMTTFLIGFVTPLIFNRETFYPTDAAALEAAMSDAPPSANKLDVKLRRSKHLI